MKNHKFTFDKALHFVREKRSIIYPNYGFIEQLKLFEKLQCELDGNLSYHSIYKTYLDRRGRFDVIKYLEKENSY